MREIWAVFFASNPMILSSYLVECAVILGITSFAQNDIGWARRDKTASECVFPVINLQNDTTRTAIDTKQCFHA